TTYFEYSQVASGSEVFFPFLVGGLKYDSMRNEFVAKFSSFSLYNEYSSSINSKFISYNISILRS
ncbi:MAG: hypothetical protein ACTSRP_21725, partial [Candidatus Helarchaeota archaeon]